MRYSDTVAYSPGTIGASALEMQCIPSWVPVPFPCSPLWARLSAPFDMEHFMTACPPVDVGRVDVDTSGTDGLRVLRCPIKVSGSMTVMLPRELEAIAPLVRHVLEIEAFQNPFFKEFWCHVSYERTHVGPGRSQRVPGWHVDGFQGVRVPRHRAEHSYLWADGSPTEYCLQPFFVSHLDAGRHNIFEEISSQAIEANAYAGLAEHVYLVDPYLVHRSPCMREGMWRTFARVTFTETELEDPGNTRNLSLETAQDYPARIDARNRLHGYRGAVPWEFYGVLRVSRSRPQALLGDEARMDGHAEA